MLFHLLCSFFAVAIFASGQLFAAENISLSDYKDIFNLPDPYQAYESSFSSFSIQSKSSFQNKRNENEIINQGSSIFDKDEKGNFQLYRKTFSNPIGVHLVYIDGQTHIQFDNEKKSKQVKFNKEFQRWMHMSINEIIHLYSEAEFKNQVIQKKGSQTENGMCWNSNNNFLCYDPNTKLPIKGELSINLSSTNAIHLTFEIKNNQPGKIKIKKAFLPTQTKPLKDIK